MDSRDYSLQAVKGIKESFDNGTMESILAYKDSRLFSMENTSEFNEIFTSTESMSGVTELSEHEEPPVLKLEDGYSVMLSDKRYGAAIVVTETMLVQAKDNTTKIDIFLTRQRDRLYRAALQHFLKNAFALYNEGFDSTSSLLAPDGVEIFGTHTWASGGTFSNKGTAKFSETAWDALVAAGGSFVDAAGDPMPISYDTIVVKKGTAAAKDAKKLFASNISPIQVASVNIYEGQVIIIETPYIVDPLNWFAIDSSKELPLYVGINEMPTLRAPFIDKDESVRTNCTAFYKVGVNNMPYSIYGSTGAVA